MKREWKKRRVLKEQADGQRRWDQAYQLLMVWSVPANLRATSQ